MKKTKKTTATHTTSTDKLNSPLLRTATLRLHKAVIWCNIVPACKSSLVMLTRPKWCFADCPLLYQWICTLRLWQGCHKRHRRENWCSVSMCCCGHLSGDSNRWPVLSSSTCTWIETKSRFSYSETTPKSFCTHDQTTTYLLLKKTMSFPIIAAASKEKLGSHFLGTCLVSTFVVALPEK